MEVVELVERCKKGERKAQALLYKTYSHKMLGICFRFVTDRQIAQDLMHDGFILSRPLKSILLSDIQQYNYQTSIVNLQVFVSLGIETCRFL